MHINTYTIRSTSYYLAVAHNTYMHVSLSVGEVWLAKRTAWLGNCIFHEHLPQFALVNMNGRVYDPVLGRFLSPDPYVQTPANTQNYNRYSYVLNNPLKYTDPSGEVIFTTLAAIFAPPLLPLAIAMDVGWMSGGVTANHRGMSFVDGAWRGLITSTLSGVAGLTVNTLTLAGGIIRDVVVGAAIGGINSILYDGSFGQGALTGAIFGLAFSTITHSIEMTRNAVQGHGFRTDIGVRRAYYKEGISSGDFSKWEYYIENRYFDGSNGHYDIIFEPNNNLPSYGKTVIDDNHQKVYSVIGKKAFRSESQLAETYAHEWAHQHYGIRQVSWVESGRINRAYYWNNIDETHDLSYRFGNYTNAADQVYTDTPEGWEFTAKNFRRFRTPTYIRMRNPYSNDALFSTYWRFNF